MEEVHSHIWASEREYASTYSEIDSIVDYNLASQCDRILIRAYYYSKLNTENPYRAKTWPDFLSNFLSYPKMTGPTSAQSMKTLQDTLMLRYGFEFADIETMEKDVPQDDLDKLTDEILKQRKGEPKPQEKLRARNDALQIIRVARDRRNEAQAGANPYGYRTWWLTQEVKSGAAAAIAFPKQAHTRYIMRPEFLINYIAYNPTTAAVRESLKTIFPSLHGVRIGARFEDHDLDVVLTKMREAQKHDPARAAALVVEYGNDLKSQLRKHLLNYP